MTRRRCRSLAVAIVVFAVVCTGSAPRAQTTPAPAAHAASTVTLDRVAQAEFLRTAKVMRSRQLSSGVTSPYRLTLNAGSVVHDAAFQSINERRTQADFGARWGSTA